jgi:hypothetical protein
MWSIWVRAEVHTGLWWGNVSEGDHMEDLGLDGRIILKMDLQELEWECVD